MSGKVRASDGFEGVVSPSLYLLILYSLFFILHIVGNLLRGIVSPFGGSHHNTLSFSQHPVLKIKNKELANPLISLGSLCLILYFAD